MIPCHVGHNRPTTLIAIVQFGHDGRTITLFVRSRHVHSIVFLGWIGQPDDFESVIYSRYYVDSISSLYFYAVPLASVVCSWWLPSPCLLLVSVLPNSWLWRSVLFIRYDDENIGWALLFRDATTGAMFLRLRVAVISTRREMIDGTLIRI